MKSRFAIGPQIAHARHHERKQWRQERLQIITNEKIFLSRFADNSRGIDRIAPMKDSVAVKHRILMSQRVVAVMIAEWPFESTLVRRRGTNQGKLSLGDQTV